MIELDPLDQICGTVRDLTSGGVEGLDSEGLERAAVLARRLRELADRLEVHALGALDDSGASDVRHGTSTAAWFARECGLPPAATNAQVKTARVLRHHLPATDQAWLDGSIGRDHVAVMVRAANPRIRHQISAAERDLLGLVPGRTFATWKDAVTSVAASLDQDGPEPDDPANTAATWVRSGELAELRARFGGCGVEVLEQIIEARTNRLFRVAAKERTLSPDLPEPSRAQLRGRAIEELLLEAAGLGTARPSRVAVNLVLRADPTGQPTVTGLPTLFEHDTEAGTDEADEAATADWPTLRSLSDVSWSLSNLNGDHLVLEHFGSLLCDCDVHPMLVDADGNPLKLGRTVRITPPKLRRAVLIRDGGCAHPGCDAPASWVDVHHVVAFEDGGTTDIDNLVALCRRHHGLAHRNEWSLVAAGDGWFWWTGPSGRGYWSQRHGTQRAGPAPPQLRAAA